MSEKTEFWVWVGIAYFILSLVSLALSFDSTTFLGMEWNWGIALFFAIILYTIASFRTIGPTELGARIFLGKPIDQVSSGFVFIPFGIFTLQTETRLIIQMELPSEPENIYREPEVGGDGKVPEGKFPPIRIPFGRPADEGSSFVLDRDPLNQRLIEEVVPIIRWRITNYVKFLTVIGDKEQARNQIEDLCVSVLSREFGQVTPSQVTADYQKYNTILTNEIKRSIGTWGITLESAKIKVINFSRSLNKAIQTIAENTAKGKAAIIEAEGLKKAAILDGEGKGAAEKAILDGRTGGLKKMKDDLGLPSEAIIGAETARAITNNPGQKTIIAGSGGFRDLAIVGAVLGETLHRKET